MTEFPQAWVWYSIIGYNIYGHFTAIVGHFMILHCFYMEYCIE